MKHHPSHRHASARFSREAAAHVRRQLERERRAERAFTARWLAYVARRRAEKAAGGGIAATTQRRAA